MKTAQTHAESKTDVIVRGVEAHEVGEAEQIVKVVYKQYGKSIEFIVAVDRMRRGLSGRLSQIEGRLYDKYTDWFFDFEHIGIRTFSDWSLDEYANLFSRD